MVHGVAWRAANAEELRLRPGPVPDAGDVLVAELVELRGAHHHVPLAGGQHGEHLAERQPALGDPLAWLAAFTSRAQQRRLAVGQQQVRLEGELRQPGAQGRDDAHRAGEDRAVAAPGLGAGDDADLGQRGRGTAACHCAGLTRRLAQPDDSVRLACRLG